MGWVFVKTLMRYVYIEAQSVFVSVWVEWGLAVTLLLEYGLEKGNLATCVFFFFFSSI